MLCYVFKNGRSDPDAVWARHSTAQGTIGPRVLDGGAYRRHLASTTERPVCGGGGAT